MSKTRLTCELVEEIGEEIEQLRFRKENLLRKSGWKYTCDTPGARWMWQKTMDDGRTLLLGLREAIDFQIQIESRTANECEHCGCDIHPSENLCIECDPVIITKGTG